jgi:multisubunit Na+/H+ antiporter MnhG subunit
VEIILFSFLSALGIILVLTRTLGFKRTMKYRKLLDVVTTFGLPVLMLGTFSGVITAFFIGLWVTGLTWLLNLLTLPTTKAPFSYGSQEKNKTTTYSYRTSRSRCS